MPPPTLNSEEPQKPIFNVFHRGGLRFGHHTLVSHGLHTVDRGELHYMRVRYADDRPPHSFV